MMVAVTDEMISVTATILYKKKDGCHQHICVTTAR